MWVWTNKSLEKQLHLGLALSLLLLFGVLWLTGERFLQRMTEDFVASRLEHDAQALLGALKIGSQQLKVRPARVNQIYQQPFSGHYYVVRLPDGRQAVSRSLWDYQLELPQLNPGQRQRLHLDGPDKQRLLVWVGGFRKQGMTLTLTVAEDVTPINTMREAFLLNFALLSLSGLVLLLLLQRWVVRRSFSRLESVKAEIQRFAEQGGQPLSEEVPQEIRPLVKAFNRLLLLLTQRNERSRNALGNLAHALKAPLNLLGRYFDRLPQAALNQEAGEARAQAERIKLLIERELKRARMAGMGTPSQRFDPRQDLADLIAVVAQVHQERSVTVDSRIAPQLTQFGDREDMFELIGNLLDNAFKWADRQVCVSLSQDAGMSISVEDDGVGLTDAELQRLTQRGSRLDESVEGHGLGLSIALDIAKLYGGGIQFDRSPDLGGLRARVTLTTT
jgi:signal transduction histidine kinase